jgi:hypothetical protein
MKRRRIPDLTSETFGRLLVLYRTDDTKQVRYMTECVCGVISPKRAASLLNGGTKSCGCLRREIARGKIADGTCQREVKHLCAPRGVKRSKAYTAWKNASHYNQSLPSFLEFCRMVGPAPESSRVRLYRRPNGIYEWSTKRLVKE